MTPTTLVLRATLLFLALACLPGTGVAEAGVTQGTWYFEFDVSPFGLPPGTVQGGFATFQKGGTLLLVDAGDFGADPILAFDTPQLGEWRASGRLVEAVGMFLRLDAATGDPLTWVRVHFTLERQARDRLEGHVTLFELACDLEGPFPLFNCPNPVAGIDDFVQNPPFEVPVALPRLETRLPAQP